MAFAILPFLRLQDCWHSRALTGQPQRGESGLIERQANLSTPGRMVRLSVGEMMHTSRGVV